MRLRVGFFILGLLSFSLSIQAEEGSAPLTSRVSSSAKAPAPAVPQSNTFANQFYLGPDQQLQYKTSEVGGLVFIQTPDRDQNVQYSVVTGFGENALRSKYFPGMTSFEDIQTYVKENLEVAEYEGVEIKRISFPSGAKAEKKTFYWVGQKSFTSLEDAQAEIEKSKALTEASGGNFGEMVKQAQALLAVPEKTPPIEIKTPAQFKKEEELALKFFDHLDIGNDIFGPFNGVTSGEPIVWQSFGEMSWRETNLEAQNYNQEVFYWSNRLVFKGIQAPLNTIDPYVEVTVNADTTGTDFKNTFVPAIGIEWRPFARNRWLDNYRPWSLGLLQFVKSYRFYLQYMNRFNTLNQITGSPSHDLRAGVGIFYEFGVDPPPPGEKPPFNLAEKARRFFWGEYYGNYYYAKTNFAAERVFDAFIFNSSIILGFKTPAIPLPDNFINNEFILMPYARFEHVNDTEFGFHYENRYFTAVGVRWMPFNNDRYRDNEWLHKTKFFFEYIGLGGVGHVRNYKEPPDTVDRDLRFGVAFSSRRY